MGDKLYIYTFNRYYSVLGMIKIVISKYFKVYNLTNMLVRCILILKNVILS